MIFIIAASAAPRCQVSEDKALRNGLSERTPPSCAPRVERSCVRFAYLGRAHAPRKGKTTRDAGRIHCGDEQRGEHVHYARGMRR